MQIQTHLIELKLIRLSISLGWKLGEKIKKHQAIADLVLFQFRSTDKDFLSLCIGLVLSLLPSSNG
ncbi:MAG: hypothetical protein Q8T09_06795 [Candidatus Melainabacteria bacterium]|nr:hypothetical protein [Candidatus Melainabacteria bacterium]